MKNRNKYIILALFLSILSSYSQNIDEKKIEALLARMTFREKIGQMSQLNGVYNDITKEKVRKGEIGTFLSFDPALVNEYQKIAVEESRLGIPLIFARDVIHGYKTIFPIPLAMAASFNPSLIERCSRIAAEEASADGIRWTFAPMVDISRDPRWGRVAEGFGEDPLLVSLMGVAAMKGFQGENLSNSSSIAACAKHYVGYAAAEGGRDYNSTYLPERIMRNLYLSPFEQLAHSGIATFMSAFNDNDGIPMSGNEFYLRKVLRDEWNYKGVVVSDWNSVDEMIAHGYAEDGKEAAYKAIHAGVDVEMVSPHYMDNAEQLLAEGKITQNGIDDAVRNVLRLKQKLGLFENPYYNDKAEKPFYNTTYLSCAKEAAEQSVVLLKNKNNTLPLSEKIKTITVLGPFADAPADQMGTWVMDGEPSQMRTPLVALKELFGDKIHIHYLPVLKSGRDKNTSRFNEAVALAKKSDVILLFIGEEAFLSGEAHSLADISIGGAQKELLEKLSAVDKPIVTIVSAGRPVPLEKEEALSDAILYTWHLGIMGGDALSDILFGKVAPSGKLPVTIPRHGGQIPIYYNHNNTGRPAPDDILMLKDIDKAPVQTTMGHTSAYLDYGKDPLYVFGYGLSYTTFDYSEMKLSKNILHLKNDSIQISCTITNTGNRAGTEIAQLYVRDYIGSITRPVRELKNFSRITLNPGEKKTVYFTLTPEELAFWGEDMRKKAEPGKFAVWIGPDSKKGLMTEFVLEN